MLYVYLAVFGALGTISRYVLDQKIIRIELGSHYPAGVFFVNILGSLLAGFLSFYFAQKTSVSDTVRIAILVGFLGAFTTFSSYCLYSLKLMNHGQMALGLVYFISTPLAGLAGVVLGMFTAKALA